MRLAVALALLALAVSVAAGPRPHVRGPVLVVDVAADAPGGEAPLDGAVALAVAALAPGELERLHAALDQLATRIEARAHPLGVDLDDDAPEAALEAALRTLRPKLTAAQALAAGRWSGAGRVVVRAAARCPSGRHARCFSAWDAPADELERRARFFAWPLASGGVLAFGSPDEARRAVLRLRARADAGDSRIALVLGAFEAQPAAARTLAADARRLAPLVDAEGGRRLLDALAAGAPPSPLPLELAPGEVLVVPRLGTLVDVPRFAREVEAALGGSAAWRQRPTALD